MGSKTKTVYTGDEAAKFQAVNADFARELLQNWIKRQQIAALQNTQAKALETKQIADLTASQNAQAAATKAKGQQEANALAASRAAAATQVGGLAPVASGWPTKAPMTSPTAKPKPLRARLFQ